MASTTEARPVTPRLALRRDALGNVLDLVDDALIGKFHALNDRLHGGGDANTTTQQCVVGRCLVEDRSVLRSPRFHKRRNALHHGDENPAAADAASATLTLSTGEQRALCSRLQQLEMMGSSSSSSSSSRRGNDVNNMAATTTTATATKAH